MTNEPMRWTDSGTAAEREMLALLGSERPSEELSARMRAVVVAPALATLGAVGSAGGAARAGDVTSAVATNTTGAATAGGGLGGGAMALGALLVTGVIGLGVYFTSRSDTAAAPAPASAPVVRGAEDGNVPSEAREVAPSVVPVGEQGAPPAATTPAVEQPTADSAVRSASGSGATTQATKGVVRPVAKASDASSLSRELAILEQARRALDRNDPRAAAGLLAAYRAEYPDGQLKSEAGVLEQRARSAR